MCEALVSEALTPHAATGVNLARALVDRPAVQRAHQIAVVAASSQVTYRELSELTNRIGNVLRQLGCAPGHRVLLIIPDSAELVAALLAVIKIGAIAVPVAPGGRAEDYAFYLQDIDASHAIAGPDSLDAVLSATANDAVADVEILAMGERRASRRVRPWQPAVDAASPNLDAHLASLDDPVLVLYTSGSTGRQKPAVHSHRAVLAAVQHVGQDVFGIQASDRILSTARAFFAFGFGFGLSMPLAAGATTILSPTKDLRSLARLIADRQPTILCGVPSLLDALLRASTWLELQLSSLRFVISAGEPLPPAVYHGYRDRFGVEVLDGMGSTELLTHVIANRPGRSRPGSCGTPVPGCDVQLVDDNGHPVADGAIGNLRVRSETAFLGYWRRPDATARMQTGQGIATGDMLYRDADGFYHFCGRSDDMLKISSLWVPPHDIEWVLRQHPGVDRCVVTTREDYGGRRRLVAYVVPTSATVRSSDLSRYAADHLPTHMIPAEFLMVAELPLTPNGKVKRSALPEPRWTSC